MQEGVASEAASLAGTLRLGKLIVLYDDNGISIEGKTGICFTEDVGKRFQAYGWHVVGPIDGMDTAAVDVALRGRGRRPTGPVSSSAGPSSATGRPTRRAPRPPTANPWAPKRPRRRRRT